MKYPTVSALCEGIAEAIKEKEGSTALINPQDFVDRINALSIGGGGEDPFLYYKIDGAACKEAFNDIGIGPADLANMYSVVTNIGNLVDAFVLYVHGGYIGKADILKGGITGNAAEWKIEKWTGVMYYPLSKDTGGYNEVWSLMGMDNSWITPCTKEEFEALITK